MAEEKSKKARLSNAWIEARDIIWKRRGRLALGFLLIGVNRLCGLVLLWPARWLSEPYFERYTPLLTQRLKRYRLVQLLWGAEWAEKLGQAA